MALYPLRQLFWECTLNCNLNCRHCGSECTKFHKAKEMPLEDFLTVLDDIRINQPSNKVFVHTLGGEPLVRKDIFQCGREITRRGFYWGMVSNAMLIDGQTMKELSRNGLRSLSIDIDGMPKQHNWLRNSDTSFDRAYNSLGYIRQAPNLLWDVITCVNQINFPFLEEIKKLLIDAGVKHWRCITISPMGNAKDVYELQLLNWQFRELMDFIVRTRNEGKINLSYGCEGYLGDYELKVRNYRFNCISGITVASILNNGDISGCLSVRSEYSQGNIYTDSFWDIWVSRFSKFRNHNWKHTGECASCEVFDKCKGGAMHLRQNDGSAILCSYKKLFNYQN